MSKMKSFVWYGEDDLKIEKKDIPSINDDEILIKVEYAGICASDLHIISGWLPAFQPPKILGHEFSGIVYKTGEKVRNFKEGERVVAHPWGACGECYYCRNGQENFCENPYNILVSPNGGAFQEYVVVKSKQVYHLPTELTLKKAALVEPTSIAVHSIGLANVKIGDTVVVLGGGAIGLLSLQIAKYSGASLVILSEPDEFRRKIGKKVGADIVIDPLNSDIKDIVLQETNGRGADICVEAAGIRQTIELSTELVKNCGTVLQVGWIKEGSEVNVNMHAVYHKQIKIQGSFWSPYSFNKTINIMAKLNIDSLITIFNGIDSFVEAIKYAKEKKGIKIVVKI
jgi:2-desacetyl-2-hydroxyethyl bacteriochlorophyllide A dehydrogenase